MGPLNTTGHCGPGSPHNGTTQYHWGHCGPGSPHNWTTQYHSIPVNLEVTTSYISAAASVQCSIQLNGTIEVFSDMTATLTAYGIVQFAHFS